MMVEGRQPIRYTDLPNVKIDEDKIPSTFRHLVKYAKLWCIGDDAIRSELLDQSSFEEKKEFVDAVSPYLEEIADWCETNTMVEELSDEVFIFENLWEPWAEARLHVYGS